MATRPSVFPEWATANNNDGPLGGPNKVEPGSTDKASGFLFPQKPPREWFNWLFNTIYSWVFYLDQEVTAGGSTSFAQDANTTTGLTFGYKAGSFHKRSDNTITTVAAGTIALTASDTNYIAYRPGIGIVKVLAPWTSNSTVGDLPLWVAVTDTDSITSLTDVRGETTGVFSDQIVTGSILNSNVTYSKIQNVSATNKLLGRYSSGAGVIEEVGLGAGLAISGGNLTTTVTAQSTNRLAVRQTVLQGSVDSSGYANFITAGSGLSVNIAATATNLVVTAANGSNATGDMDYVGVVSADTTIGSLTASNTNYLYADIASDGTVTLGKTTLAPLYQFGGSVSTVNGQFTFNIQQMRGYVGNGSSGVQTYRVYIGEAVCDGSSVTSVVNYALMGRYRSAATSVTINTAYDFSHKIGVEDVILNGYLRESSSYKWAAIASHAALEGAENRGRYYGVKDRNTAQLQTAQHRLMSSITGGIVYTSPFFANGSTGLSFTTGQFYLEARRGW